MNKPRLPKLKRKRRKPQHAAQGAHQKAGTGRYGYTGQHHRASRERDYEGRHRSDDEERYVRPEPPAYAGGRRATRADDRRSSAHYRSANR